MNDLCDNELRFKSIKIHFIEDTYENIFSNKNNKTVEETLKHQRYRKLQNQIELRYPSYLNWRLGNFLLELKSKNDDFYLRFLNKYGDLNYGTFYINDPQYLDKKGLYLYSINGKIMYVGRCRDSFKKRINQGYGKIHPKNCYIDGQATNCHLNHLITKNKNDVKLFICDLEKESDIIKLEEKIIRKYKPPWNITLSKW
ncbi:MAG: hypothetical protein U9R43_05605 [Thermodesulfobacteriota bacterium]|nr:hypothetical protein [Thermodesulfobacteriota bacterium]